MIFREARERERRVDMLRGGRGIRKGNQIETLLYRWTWGPKDATWEHIPFLRINPLFSSLPLFFQTFKMLLDW